VEARRDIIALAVRAAMPMMHEWPEFVEKGGLISYGTDVAAVRRQAGVHVARIMIGDKPASAST
jgi:ABC-type uncharacterized transport system substrate-binding protein